MEVGSWEDKLLLLLLLLLKEPERQTLKWRKRLLRKLEGTCWAVEEEEEEEVEEFPEALKQFQEEEEELGSFSKRRADRFAAESPAACPSVLGCSWWSWWCSTVAKGLAFGRRCWSLWRRSSPQLHLLHLLQHRHHRRAPNQRCESDPKPASRRR